MQEISNIKSGTSFEKQFAKMLSERGFWAHLMTANQQGQPSDVIISKNNRPALIDCKVCNSNKFLFSRIEENQWSAMQKWAHNGNALSFFALLIQGEIYLVSFEVIKILAIKGAKQLNFKQIQAAGYTLDEWEAKFWRLQ